MSNTAFPLFHIVPESKKAFSDKNSNGVVLLINFPGENPVHALIIRDTIIELKSSTIKK